MNFIFDRIKAEPAGFMAVVSAGINLAVLFGLSWTTDQVVALNIFLALLVGFLTRTVVTPNHIVDQKVEVALRTPVPSAENFTIEGRK